MNTLRWRALRPMAWSSLTLTLALALCGAATAQGRHWRDAPAYAPERAQDVLRRSVYFLPLFGATYPEKFEVMLQQLPPQVLRGVIVYNHGCGGQWGWETHVAQFFYRQGFAVVAPDFSSRQGNLLGCAGSNEEEARRSGGQKAREGVYSGINPARLAARGDDVRVVLAWLKARTPLPLLVGGHSEGCRTTYAMHIEDPQVVGGICIKQGLQDSYEHTWGWNTQKPMWQSLEEFDPWVMWGANTVHTVGFERKFTSAPHLLTVVRVPGHTHEPINHPAERQSLSAWLQARVPGPWAPGLQGFDYEKTLPTLQERMRGPAVAPTRP